MCPITHLVIKSLEMKQYLKWIALLSIAVATPCMAEEMHVEPIVIDYMVTYSLEVEEAAGGGSYKTAGFGQCCPCE